MQILISLEHADELCRTFWVVQEQEYFDNAILMVAMIKANSALACIRPVFFPASKIDPSEMKMTDSISAFLRMVQNHWS